MEDSGRKAVFVGTSGFSYKDWLGNFYPQFCPDADFLRYYSTIFKTVEIDSTYYRIPTQPMIDRWNDVTPDNFTFTAKFPSSVTHEGDINSRLDNACAFVEVMSHLNKKLGPLLMQFPYGFKPTESSFDLLQKLLKCVPDNIKLAVEVRNKKWLTETFYNLLKEHKAGLVMVDHPWMPKKTAFTASFLYLRFLGDRKKISSDFSFPRDERKEEIDYWSTLIEEFSRERGEVYAYFNNHYSGHSPSTALRLIEKLGPYEPDIT